MTQPSEIADYTIVGPLHSSRLWRARPPARLGLTDDEVVVKLIPGGDDAAFRRFTRELRLIARVSSPHLVRLLDAGQHEAAFFYALEFCPHRSLADEPPLDRRAKIRAVADAARAAHALHEHGIAHRDIRPGNVLVRADGAGVLSDLSRALSASATVTSMAPMKSLGFVDPAELRGEPAGRATDVYSLGATLHWVLTGRHLFANVDGSDAILAMRTILASQPSPAAEGLTDDERNAIAECVDLSAARRPPTAAAVAERFDALADATAATIEASA